MIYLKRFNESISSYKELEFDDDMMYDTSVIHNFFSRNYQVGISKMANTIKDTLREDVFYRLFIDVHDYMILANDIYSFFMHSAFNRYDLERMFNKVTVHGGSDDEDEYVVALEILGHTVLLLASPDRGSSIRIGQHNNYQLSLDEIVDIVKVICEIFNEKY